MKILTILAVVICLTSGCVLFTLNNYSVGFRNISEHTIFVKSGIIGNYAPPVGILPPTKGGDTGSLCHSGTPGIVKIKWKKEDKSIVERDVKVNLPTWFWNGDEIIFNINDKDEVILSFRVKASKFKEIDSDGNEVDYSPPKRNLPGEELTSGSALFSTGRKYYVGVRNICENTIFFSTSAVLSDNTSGVEIIPLTKGIDDSLLGHNGIPKSVKINWVKKDQSVVDRDVKIKGNFPKGFRNGDTIIFNINDQDEVLLSFNTRNSKFEEINSQGNEVNYSHYEISDASSPVKKSVTKSLNENNDVSNPNILAVQDDLWNIKDIKIINHVDGRFKDNIYTEYRNAYSCQPPRFPGKQLEILCQSLVGSSTSTTVLYDENFWLIAIICTKIRADYPQDDSLLETKIYPKLDMLEQMGKDKYKRFWETENGQKIIKELNTSPSYEKLKELEWGFEVNGFTKSDWCRIDRHFVKNGFYFQVISFTLADKNNETVCDKYNKFIVNQIIANATNPEKTCLNIDKTANSTENKK